MNIKEKKADFSLLLFKNLVLYDYYPHWIQQDYTDSNKNVNRNHLRLLSSSELANRCV